MNTSTIARRNLVAVSILVLVLGAAVLATSSHSSPAIRPASSPVLDGRIARKGFTQATHAPLGGGTDATFDLYVRPGTGGDAEQVETNWMTWDALNVGDCVQVDGSPVHVHWVAC